MLQGHRGGITVYTNYAGSTYFMQFTDGYLRPGDMRNHNGHSWAVRDGDVAATVPIPSGLLLLGSGLASLGIFGRKTKKRHTVI